MATSKVELTRLARRVLLLEEVAENLRVQAGRAEEALRTAKKEFTAYLNSDEPDQRKHVLGAEILSRFILEKMDNLEA